METEKKESEKVQKNFTIGVQMNHMEDLGTDDPKLEITIANNGPSRKIEFCITDGRGGQGTMQQLFNGDTREFLLGQNGKGNFLMIVNKEYENAKVAVRF
ncbi:hypothetical protein [Flavobacterium sp.]|uniref:hypothetical protein n=1 Tax=Flavobacterium sp. TaxID=239 RepID=UPI0026164A50|nr:hypothetical protein [Flavobacterium sp.]